MLREHLTALVEAVRNFLWNVDLGTWLAHGFQGFAVAALFDLAGDDGHFAAMALMYHGLARELPGLKAAAAKGDTPKVVDGLFDAAAFLVGQALYVFVRALVG